MSDIQNQLDEVNATIEVVQDTLTELKFTMDEVRRTALKEDLPLYAMRTPKGDSVYGQYLVAKAQALQALALFRQDRTRLMREQLEEKIQDAARQNYADYLEACDE